MKDYIENDYVDSEYEDLFYDWYEIEGARKINELSRQLRTFFNYKMELTRFRFRSKSVSAENNTDTQLFMQKQKLDSLIHNLIIILNKLKRNSQTLEQGIQSLFFENDPKQLMELTEIIEKLSAYLHIISEDKIHMNPKFLRFVAILAQNICMVKKCLNIQFKEFYGELEINYNNLERELEELLSPMHFETNNIKNQFEEKLTS